MMRRDAEGNCFAPMAELQRLHAVNLSDRIRIEHEITSSALTRAAREAGCTEEDVAPADWPSAIILWPEG
jgi:hypothetical protein